MFFSIHNDVLKSFSAQSMVCSFLKRHGVDSAKSGCAKIGARALVCPIRTPPYPHLQRFLSSPIFSRPACFTLATNSMPSWRKMGETGRGENDGRRGQRAFFSFLSSLRLNCDVREKQDYTAWANKGKWVSWI